jgi:hypothetical protein
MGKTIITHNDVYEINQSLKEKELKFKLHLHDVCGSQSFTLELLGSNMNKNHYDEMKKVILGYFEAKYVKVEFLENSLEFIIIQ